MQAVAGQQTSIRARGAWDTRGSRRCFTESKRSCRRQIRKECQAQGSEQREASFSRRDLLITLSVSPLLGLVAPASAAADELPLTQYTDGPDEFTVLVPEGWSTGEGQADGARFGGSTGARRTLAWYPEGELGSTSISIIVTNTSADFTRLGSFGTASTFGDNLVSSMDRSFMRKAAWGRKSDKEQLIQEARLLAAKERNSLYYIDYALKKPGESDERIFQSAVALGFNGRYNRLYTVTAQCLQKDFPKLGSTLEKVVGSFKPPEPVV